MTDPFDDKGIHLKGFPDSTLLDIARNGAAQRDYRLTAVEILKTRKSPRISHPDIQDLVHELEIELDGIVFENPAPSGALKASVTTKTMAEDVEVIDNTQEVPSKPISEANVRLINSMLVVIPEENILRDPPEVVDVPPTETETVQAKTKKTRKPKEPTVNDPQPE